MFGLFRRAPAPRAGGGWRTVLRLEALAARDQPSGLDVLGNGFWADTVIQLPVPTGEAPAITEFTAREVGTGLFLITGRVTGDSPGGLVVTLGGSTSAAGRQVTTLADGTFSMTVRLAVDGTDCGYITATTTDAQGRVSEEVMVFVDPTRA